MELRPPLPPAVIWAWHPWATAREEDLPAEERAALTPAAVPKRRQEFAAGRSAAREALLRLGLDPPPPVPRGADRAPVWPPGVVGALSHAHGQALAVVAWARDSGGLGVDLEHRSGVRRPEIARLVADAAEQAWIAAGPEPERRLTALFSAKEAVFKALYPRAGRYFGFSAVSGRYDAAAGAFCFTLAEPLGRGYPVGARLWVPVVWSGDFVLTALSLPPAP